MYVWTIELRLKCLFKRNQTVTIEEQLCFIIKKTFPENCTALHCLDVIIAIVFLGRAIQRQYLAKTINLRVRWFSYSGGSPTWLHLVSHPLTRGLALSTQKNDAAINFDSMERSLFLIIHYLASLNILLLQMVHLKF